ncbi:MAG TPA: NUDIX domain-containing protein [Candidatus Saccharimonadales bacterium]|nr:NUDIX domain-containing protein [Candidatus Saccharimonadales bacterium]
MRTILPTNAKLVPKNAKLVFKGIIYDTYQWQQKMFDDSYETFEMLRRPDTLKALAVKENKIILLEQQQPDSSDVFYDLPGGRHDVSGETELEGTKRELLEETGMTFKNWKLIDITQPFSKVELFVYVFLATDFQNQVKQSLDSGEKIKVLELSLAELKKLVGNLKARYLPKDLLEGIDSIEQLLNLPEYKRIIQE